MVLSTSPSPELKHLICMLHAPVCFRPFCQKNFNSAGVVLKGGDGDDCTHLSLKSFRSAPPICQQTVLSKKWPWGWMCWSLILPSWAGLGDCSVMNARGKSNGQRWFLGTSVPPPRWALSSLSPFGCPCWAQRCQECEGRAPLQALLCPPTPHWLQQQWSRFNLIVGPKSQGVLGSVETGDSVFTALFPSV